MRAPKTVAREKRKKRIRSKIFGDPKRPRLAVYKSNTNIYAQVVNDIEGKTLVSASTLDKNLKSKLKAGSKVEAAKQVGALVAEKALAKSIKEVVFDRSGFLFHGRVKALADAAREKGLKF